MTAIARHRIDAARRAGQDGEAVNWRVIQGDCLSELPKFAAGEFDAVITDPPYGMNANNDSRRFSGGLSSTCNRKHGAGRNFPATIGDDRPFDPTPWLDFPSVVLWGSNHYAQRLPVGTTLVWCKRRPELFGTFLSDCEIGWMKGGHGVYAFYKQFPPPVRAMDRGGDPCHPTAIHPNQKPLALMRWCIEKTTKPGDRVLDPFMGSGTTGVACAELGRDFVGVEIDPGYCEIARKRIDVAARQLKLNLPSSKRSGKL